MTKGTVSGVIANMVTLRVDGPVKQGEICYIETGGDRLMSEVIKVIKQDVYVQVFESTRGLKVGSTAEFTGRMLEVQLAPGMLSKNYDGLQNDLDKMEGVFLRRGQYTDPLDRERLWDFEPLVKVGDTVESSAWLGKVEENCQPLKIMAPFQLEGTATVTLKVGGDGVYALNTTAITVTVNKLNTTVDVSIPEGAVTATASAKGLTGKFDVTIGVDENGAVNGIEIGDADSDADAAFLSQVSGNNAFLSQFIGTTGNVSAEGLDLVTGATISSRGVVDAVNKAYNQAMGIEEEPVATEAPSQEARLTA